MDLKRFLREETLARVGYRPLVSIRPEATIAQAVETMRASNVGCVLVVASAKLCGIFTERDLVTRVLAVGRSLEEPVSAVMTPEPAVAREQEPICQVLSRMHAGGYRHLAVVGESGQPLGTVSVKRVAGFIADHYHRAVCNLPPEPHQYGHAREGA